MEPRAGQPGPDELLFGLSAYAVPGDSPFRAIDLDSLLAIPLVGRLSAVINLSYTDKALQKYAVQAVLTRLTAILRDLGCLPGQDSIHCVAAKDLSLRGSAAVGPLRAFTDRGGQLFRLFGHSGLPEPLRAADGGIAFQGSQAANSPPGAQIAPTSVPSVSGPPAVLAFPVLLIHGLQDVDSTELSVYWLSDAIRAFPGPVLAISTSEEIPYPIIELFDLTFNCLSDEVALPVPRGLAGMGQPSDVLPEKTLLDPGEVLFNFRLQKACTNFLLRLAEVHVTALVGDSEVVSEGPRLTVLDAITRFSQARAAMEGRRFCEPQDLALAILCAVPHQLRLMPVMRVAECRGRTQRLVYRKTCRLLEELIKAWL